MIVLVESNFVLELAFRQQEVAHAERLMDLAAQKRIELAIPGCALFEPFETLIPAAKRTEGDERSLPQTKCGS